ncbi:penicillin acylase family protein [Vibrio sp.]|uniref:penicillin acylase family protein n=1 Tax=Vibrio sp. TaxID=678 RepID=UPI003D140C30
MHNSLCKQVTIRWTENEVPHITANDYESLGFGYGYVHARDRLCEVSGQAITLRGERSKHYGAEQFSTIGFLKTTNLNSDLMFRLRLPKPWVANELNKLSKNTRAYIRGYVAGLNHYVSQMTEEERATISPDEVLVHFEEEDVVRAAMRFGIMKELVEIGPYLVSSATQWRETPPHHADDLPHAKPIEVEGGFGSNAWAYGGDVVEGKHAILLGNPHSAWKRTPHQQRIYMHQYHLTIPGELDVAGTSFLGFPFPMTGYNRHVAWSILDAATVTPFVLQKMAINRVQDSWRYRMDDQEKALSLKSIVIEVVEDSGQVASRCYEFLESEWGPLYYLPQRPGKPEGWYAITNPGEHNAKGLDQFLAAAHATSTREFVTAIEHHRGILCQLIVADKAGDIAYVIAGNVPPISDQELEQYHVDDDSAAFNVLDGTRSCASLRDTNGHPLMAPTSFYPTILSRGIIHNTNNSYKFTEYGKTQPDYPSVFGQHKENYQIGKPIAAKLHYDPRLIMSAQRMKELLAEGPITAEKVLPVIFDNRNYAAETFLDDLLMLENVHSSQAVQRACQVLRRWDRKNNSQSKGALLFHQFWNRIVQKKLLRVPSNGDPELGSQLDISPKHIPIILQALEETVCELDCLGFALDKAWGEVLYQTTGGVQIPLHGGSYQEGLLNGEMPAPLCETGFPYILFGSAYIQLVTWQEGELVVHALLSHGQRDGVESLGRTAQLTLFANKQLYRIPYSKQDLNMADVIDALTLSRSSRDNREIATSPIKLT